MPLRLIDRYHPQQRHKIQSTIEAGQLEKHDELRLLAPEQIQPLAQLSLFLLIVGAVFFILLDLLAYLWQTHLFPSGFTWWQIVLLLAINILGYIAILPIHEALHGAAFAFWGGKPHFGTKLPFALYCGAKGQLFHRNHYLVVGLTPLIVISLAGIILTLLVPTIAAYTILATAGNLSGAAGDIWVAQRLLRLPPRVLVEDTETGYSAWLLPHHASHPDQHN